MTGFAVPGTWPGIAPCCQADRAVSRARRAWSSGGKYPFALSELPHPATSASSPEDSTRPISAPHLLQIVGLGVNPQWVNANHIILDGPFTFPGLELDRVDARTRAGGLLRED